MKKLFTKGKMLVGGLVVGIMSLNVALADAAVDAVTKPFLNLQSLLSTAASGIGIVWLILGVIGFARANANQDASGKNQALMNIFSAVVLASAGVIATFLIG